MEGRLSRKEEIVWGWKKRTVKKLEKSKRIDGRVKE